MQQNPGLFDDDENTQASGTGEAVPELLEKLKELSIQAYDNASLAGLSGDGPPYSYARLNIGLYVKRVLAAAEYAAGKSAARGGNIAAVQTAAREAADRAAVDRGDPLVHAVLAAAYKTGWEIHRIMGFLRFVPVERKAEYGFEQGTEQDTLRETFYLARCAPDNFILPCMAEHFTPRFGEKPWAVIDEKRGLILIRRPGKEVSLETFGAEGLEAHTDSPQESFSGTKPEGNSIEDYWRLYHQSVLIENRKNLKLQRQFIPLRYRKYLTEFD
ncbi:MAG: TIGR03915 family putative DNA repair protein [Treponema sp.]|jgi:probable DNA metabolism protein|nr:TIGR03915 family putative DNA repair protein [Treponema sp.]